MIDSTTGLLDFLEQLRRERDETVALIASIEKRLGIQAASSSEPSNGKSDGGAPQPRVKVSVDSIPVGFFHNMSQPQATEKLLRLNPGQPLTSSQILDSFRKSGMELNPKNSSTILYTALTRSPKFERVAGKAWGLAEWYPEKKKRAESKETEPEQGQTQPL